MMSFLAELNERIGTRVQIQPGLARGNVDVIGYHCAFQATKVEKFAVRKFLSYWFCLRNKMLTRAATVIFNQLICRFLFLY